MLDERTLEVLFRSHFKGLCQFALGYVKDDEAAKEIVQDAFVKLWERRQSIDLSKSVTSYLSTMIRNKCLNHLRDNRKFSGDLQALENLPGESMHEQGDHLVESDLRGQIAEAIDELPEKCREVFRMSRYRQLRYQQIADELGISVKTVETQMSKALQHLRTRLAEYLPFIFVFVSVSRCLAVSLPLFDFAKFTHITVISTGIRDFFAVHYLTIFSYLASG